jgi:hypothetical protein
MVGAGEAGDAACRGEELGGQSGPHPGQASDEGRVRVLVEQLGDLAIELVDLGLGLKGFGGQVLDDGRGDLFAGHRDALGLGGGQGGSDQPVDHVAAVPAAAEQVGGDPGRPGAADLGRESRSGPAAPGQPCGSGRPPAPSRGAPSTTGPATDRPIRRLLHDQLTTATDQ